MSRLPPLSRAACPADFDALFALTEQVMGFVPNSMFIMARDPDLRCPRSSWCARGGSMRD